MRKPPSKDKDERYYLCRMQRDGDERYGTKDKEPDAYLILGALCHATFIQPKQTRKSCLDHDASAAGSAAIIFVSPLLGAVIVFVFSS